jgi:LPS-assembly protein
MLIIIAAMTSRSALTVALTSPQPRYACAVALTLLTAAAATRADAADQCPDANAAEEATLLPPLLTPTDEDIDIVAEKGFDATLDGPIHYKGKVSITQPTVGGERRITTSDVIYDPATESFRVDQPVEYSDPNLKVSGERAHVESAGGATFEGAEFELPARNARGGADRINATLDGELELEGVRYTTCPLGNDDWLLRAAGIDIDQRSGTGNGHGVRLDFKGIPILYTPFISFPVGNQRKSGFLFPTFGNSSSSGTTLAVPWYWNIAPNYDATFVPTWYSKRGGKLDSEFRYLSSYGRGAFNAEYLPDDQERDRSRSLLHLIHQTDFSRHVRLDAEAANASDSQWFEDFGLGQEGTSVTYLSRYANFTYLSDHWFATARAQNFQTIDDTIDPRERPYTILPQLAVRAAWPERLNVLTLGLDWELANFQHDFRDAATPKPTGWRMDFAPEVRMPLRGGSIYLEPAAGWRHTAYKLDNVAAGQDEEPSRSAPMFSLDGGMTFERNWGSRSQRLQTLEPRFMYLYVPYRGQDDLPVFDTELADLNVVQLFRTNRYAGPDRLSDANQLAIGVTSRLLDADTGQQFLAATVGQVSYFDEPRVALPGETLDDTESSDYIAELNLTAYSNWTVRMGVQWDPGDTRSERGDVQLQYRPGDQSVVNLGYRFRRGLVEQVDGSAAWPIGDKWSVYARMVYSLDQEATLDQFAGLEYRACCWRMRVVTRRYVSDRNRDVDTSFLLQLELNGLSSVGVGADAFLEKNIRGYSTGAAPSQLP